jgi:hypothetical protein
LPPLPRVTRVDITDNSAKVFRRIETPAEVQRIVQFADDHKSGWHTPWAGVPVPSLHAAFYDGDRYVGHFGVGGGFF